ncbi:MAG TPA: hypothetical protein VER57_02015, partial [Cyanobium sp.]|nr:hypothetical protein [Cyanobium sp.]
MDLGDGKVVARRRLKRMAGYEALEPDPSAIRDHHVLIPERGFRVSGLEHDDLDFSDLCHDRQRDRFWILSEQASALFLYDWAAGRVEATLPLRHRPPGSEQPIAKAEGLAGRGSTPTRWVDQEGGSGPQDHGLGQAFTTGRRPTLET